MAPSRSGIWWGFGRVGVNGVLCEWKRLCAGTVNVGERVAVAGGGICAVAIGGSWRFLHCSGRCVRCWRNAACRVYIFSFSGLTADYRQSETVAEAGRWVATRHDFELVDV